MKTAVLLSALLLPATGAAGLELPDPDLSGLEAAVAEQLRGMQELARSAVEEGRPAAEIAEAIGELGRLYHAYDLVGPAEQCYRRAEELAPESFSWPYHLGYLLQGDGRLEEAADYYERSLATVSGVTPALVRLGDTYLALGRLAAAERNYRAALRIDSSSPSALAGLGQLFLQKNEYVRAVELLEAALRLQPAASRLYHPLGMAYRGLGQADKARQALARSGPVGVRPADPLIDGLRELATGERVHLLRGRAALRAGRLEEAAEEFGLAVEAAPESVPGRVNLGNVLARQGHVDAAISQFERVVEIAPGNANAHFNLGSLHRSRGELEEALEAFRQAALYEPGKGETRLQLAEMLNALGRLDEALLHYRRSTELAPPAERARLGEARILVVRGEYAQARSVLERGLELLPTSRTLAFALGRILAACPDPALRDGERALRIARAVFAVEPTLPHAELVGSALAEVGRCDEAAMFLEEIVARTDDASPDSPALTRLAEARRSYEAGPPCRPWMEVEP